MRETRRPQAGARDQRHVRAGVRRPGGVDAPPCADGAVRTGAAQQSARTGGSPDQDWDPHRSGGLRALCVSELKI